MLTLSSGVLVVAHHGVPLLRKIGAPLIRLFLVVTYEFLQRKVALEKLKEAHEELENVNLSPCSTRISLEK